MQEVSVLFEDEVLLVVNKPAGLNADIDKFSHPSVEGWAMEYMLKKNKPAPFLLHRIDRPTSGIMILVKKKSALKKLTEQMDQFSKIYLALTEQKPSPPEGKLVHPVYKDLLQKKLIVFDAPEAGKAKEARLRYSFRKSDSGLHLLEVHLETGRYHQIRAQLAHMGWPVIGDKTYGSGYFFGENRIGLHAWKTEFIHPATRRPVSIEAPLPEYWPIQM